MRIEGRGRSASCGFAAADAVARQSAPHQAEDTPASTPLRRKAGGLADGAGAAADQGDNARGAGGAGSRAVAAAVLAAAGARDQQPLTEQRHAARCCRLS
eukprot:826664-Rhodomonas_salina.2